MDIYLVHRFTMRIQVGGSSRSWTVSFIVVAGVLPTSRELRSQLRDVVVQRQRLMFLINISVSRR